MKTINRKRLVVIDGDDTLWRTQELFDKAKDVFSSLMKRIGVKADVVAELDIIDAERVKLHNFNQSRFLESMLITYSIYCGRYQLKWDIKIEKRIRKIIGQLQKTPRLYTDTIPALEKLSNNYKIILYTVGDATIKKDKIQKLGKEFLKYFDCIYISETKTVDDLRSLLNSIREPIDRIWIVGNSLRSDIVPAMKLGLKVVWVPRGTWLYDGYEMKKGKNIIKKQNLLEASKEMLWRDYGKH